jgi:hypothetical protein
MTNTESTVKTLAEQLSAALETRTRDNGDKFVCLKDGSPEWMTDVIHAVHGDALPNDVTYRFIEKCADAIANADEDADLDEVIYEIESDIYTTDLMEWARTNYEYCDQAIQEGLWSDKGTFTDLVMMGQSIHIREIGAALIAELTNAADTDEE